MTEELRHVGRQDTGFFEPRSGFVTKIAKLEAIESRRLPRVLPGRPDRFDALAEAIAKHARVRRKRLA